MVAHTGQSNMEEAIAHPDVDVVCIALPNNLHEAAVMLCCKHKKAVITHKTTWAEMRQKQNACWRPWKKQAFLMATWKTLYIHPNF